MNPIEDLLNKKQIAHYKLETQIEDAKDGVRRAKNKLMNKENALSLREYELKHLRQALETVKSFEEPMQKLSDAFEEIMEMSIPDWQALAQADMKTAPHFREGALDIIKKYNIYQVDVREQEAFARKIYYNR